MSACIQNTGAPVSDLPESTLSCEKNDHVQCMPEVNPRPRTQCDETPEDICRVEGLVLATASECEAGEMCEEVVGSLECEESVTVLCKNDGVDECLLDIPVRPKYYF